MKKRISLLLIVLIFLQLLIPISAIATYQGQPESYREFENYLNSTYGSVNTSIGTIELKHGVVENFMGVNIYRPYDMWIDTDWDAKIFSPYIIKYGTDMSATEKSEIMHQLIEIQKNIYSDAIARFPDLKIRGGYYTSFYEYPAIRAGFVSIDFLSWCNYTIDKDNSTITIDEFKWNFTLDDYDFSEYTQSSEESKTQPQKSNKKVCVITKNANLHIKASSSSEILLIIPKGKTVSCIGQTTSFYKVDYMGNIGYVLKSSAKLSK